MWHETCKCNPPIQTEPRKLSWIGFYTCDEFNWDKNFSTRHARVGSKNPPIPNPYILLIRSDKLSPMSSPSNLWHPFSLYSFNPFHHCHYFPATKFVTLGLISCLPSSSLPLPSPYPQIIISLSLSLSH